MTKLFVTVRSFLARKEEGATMVEYGLMLALIAAVCIAAVTTVGSNANTIYNNVASVLGKA